MIKDSGQRSEFSTGAHRDCQEGKGRMDLLPFRALIELAKVYEEGAKKYDDNNWRKGIPLSRYVDSATRHLAKWMIGWRDEPHLAQAAWNIMSLIETQAMIAEGLLPAELNDLPYNIIEQLENPNNIPPLKTAGRKVKQPTFTQEEVDEAYAELVKMKPVPVGRPLPDGKLPGFISGLEFTKPVCAFPSCKCKDLPQPDPEMVKKSMEDISAGRTRPIQEVIEEYKKNMAEDHQRKCEEMIANPPQACPNFEDGV